MVNAMARIRVHNDYESVVPILIPELDEVRCFADEVRCFAVELHARGESWSGDAFGWRAE